MWLLLCLHSTLIRRQFRICYCADCLFGWWRGRPGRLALGFDGHIRDSQPHQRHMDEVSRHRTVLRMVGDHLTNVIGNASRRHLYGAKEGTDAMPPSDRLRYAEGRVSPHRVHQIVTQLSKTATVIRNPHIRPMSATTLSPSGAVCSYRHTRTQQRHSGGSQNPEVPLAAAVQPLLRPSPLGSLVGGCDRSFAKIFI